MHKIVQPLSESVRPRFIVDIGGKKRTSHSALISYCYDILDGRNMSCVKNGATIYTSIQSLSSMHDSSELKVGSTRIAYKVNEVM